MVVVVVVRVPVVQVPRSVMVVMVVVVLFHSLGIHPLFDCSHSFWHALVSVLLLPQGSGARSGATLRMAKARMPEAEGVSGHSGFRAELRLLHTYSITT